MALRLLILAALLAASSAAGSFMDCYNQDFVFEPTDWEKAVVKAETPRLHLEKAWISKKPPRLPVTIVTHTQTNRDKHLNQCRTWKGPLVAAIYLPLVQPSGKELGPEQRKVINETIEELDHLHKRVELDNKCQLTMLLFWEVYSNVSDTWLYPHNSLRNLALLQVRTPFLAMVDVDLLLSASFSQELQSPGKMVQLADKLNGKKVMGFAAFEPSEKSRANLPKGRRLVASAVMGDKPHLLEMMAKGRIIRFLDDVFPPAQNCSNYELWERAIVPYPVTYAWHYEPWFIIEREINPYYDTRYRGYFFDKVLHAAHLNATGFQFLIHPTAFIVHRPHPVSRVRSSKTLFDALHNTMRDRAEGALKEMAAKTYSPRIDKATERCSKVIPWLVEKEYDWKNLANWGPIA